METDIQMVEIAHHVATAAVFPPTLVHTHERLHQFVYRCQFYLNIVFFKVIFHLNQETKQKQKQDDAL